MTLLVLTFICGLIAAPLIKVSLDDRLIQFVSSGYDQAKVLLQKSVEAAWKHYQTRQGQGSTASNGAVSQYRELLVSPQSQDSVQK